MPRLPLRRQHEPGMTLIEVVVATALLSAALVGCLTLQRNMARAAARHVENLRMLNLARELRATYRLEGRSRDEEGPAPAPYATSHRYQIRREPVPLAVEGYSILLVEVSRPRDPGAFRDTGRVSWRLRSTIREAAP